MSEESATEALNTVDKIGAQPPCVGEEGEQGRVEAQPLENPDPGLDLVDRFTQQMSNLLSCTSYVCACDNWVTNRLCDLTKRYVQQRLSDPTYCCFSSSLTTAGITTLVLGTQKVSGDYNADMMMTISGVALVFGGVKGMFCDPNYPRRSRPNQLGENPPGENPPGANPPGANPPGANPPGENPPGENPPGENPPGDGLNQDNNSGYGSENGSSQRSVGSLINNPATSSEVTPSNYIPIGQNTLGSPSN